MSSVMTGVLREKKNPMSRQELELFLCRKGMAAKIFVTKKFEGLSPTEFFSLRNRLASLRVRSWQLGS